MFYIKNEVAVALPPVRNACANFGLTTDPMAIGSVVVLKWAMIMGFSYHPRSFLKTKFGKNTADKNAFASWRCARRERVR